MLGTQCSAGDDQVPYLTPGEITYEEARRRHPAACDPHERIKLMDQEGFDISILYPTASLQWQNDVTDPDIAAAYCEVYNDWVAEFCMPYPDRLVPATQVSLLDVDRGIKELERARKLGHKALFLRTAPDSGIPYSEPYYYPFWGGNSGPGRPRRPPCGSPARLGGQPFRAKDGSRLRLVVLLMVCR